MRGKELSERSPYCRARCVERTQLIVLCRREPPTSSIERSTHICVFVHTRIGYPTLTHTVVVTYSLSGSMQDDGKTMHARARVAHVISQPATVNARMRKMRVRYVGATLAASSPGWRCSAQSLMYIFVLLYCVVMTICANRISPRIQINNIFAHNPQKRVVVSSHQHITSSLGTTLGAQHVLHIH